MIIPLLTYSCPVQTTYTDTQLAKFLSLERRAKSIIPFRNRLRGTHDQLKRECAVMVNKCVNKEFNCDIFNSNFEAVEHEINTRNNLYGIKLPRVKLEVARRGFYFAGGNLYNSLPLAIRKVDRTLIFKERVSRNFN